MWGFVINEYCWGVCSLSPWLYSNIKLWIAKAWCWTLGLIIYTAPWPSLVCFQASGRRGEVSCCLVLQVQESHTWPRLWPLRPTTPRSSQSPLQISCPSGWERVKSKPRSQGCLSDLFTNRNISKCNHIRNTILTRTHCFFISRFWLCKEEAQE